MRNMCPGVKKFKIASFFHFHKTKLRGIGFEYKETCALVIESKTGIKRFNLNRVRVLIFVMNDINFKGNRRHMIIYPNHDLCCNILTAISTITQ